MSEEINTLIRIEVINTELSENRENVNVQKTQKRARRSVFEELRTLYY